MPNAWEKRIAEMFRGIAVLIILVIILSLIFKEGKAEQSIPGRVMVLLLIFFCLAFSIPRIISGIKHFKD